MKKLSRSFYNRATLTVAEELIGSTIVYDHPDGRMSARIVEVEAYIGHDDPACHAARGKTSRNEIMFGEPGHAYIYFIYGMYHCLNFVTERAGFAAAVLLRAAEPIEGIDLMAARSNSDRPERMLNGPGKFCRAFDLSRDQNGLDLTKGPLYLAGRTGTAPRIARSARIGIREGIDKPWRLYDAESAAVSRSIKRTAAIARGKEGSHG